MNAKNIPPICSCFGGFVMDDCDRLQPCDRCQPKAKPSPAPEYRESWRDRPDHDMSPWGSDLRSGR